MRMSMSRMKWAVLLPFVVGCGNKIGKSDCANSAPDNAVSTKLSLATSSIINVQQGGFIAFDQYDLDELVNKGAKAASTLKNQGCSSTFDFSKDSVKAFVNVTTTLSCLKKFLFQSTHQRILVYVDAQKRYQAIELNDSRIDAFAKIMDKLENATAQYRRSHIESLQTMDFGGYVSNYGAQILGLSDSALTDFNKRFCVESGKATPTPADCTWISDSISIKLVLGEAKDSSIVNSLIEKSLAYRLERYSKLALLDKQLADDLKLFNEKSLEATDVELEVNPLTNASNFITCGSGGTYGDCDNRRLEYGKLQTDFYAPVYSKIIEDYFNQPYSKTVGKAFVAAARAEVKKTHLDPLLKPAFEAYIRILGKLGSNQPFLSIQTNHLNHKIYAPLDFGFADLSTFSKQLPEVLSGINVSVDDYHLNVSNSSPKTNQNLTRNTQAGSVLAIGGIPFLAFTPSSIDQSDRTSTMPLPDPGNTQVPLREQSKDASGTKDTTNGKGLKSDKAKCAL